MSSIIDETIVTYETDDDLLELSFSVLTYSGRISGPVELCYPSESTVEDYKWRLNGEEISEEDIPEELIVMSKKMIRYMDTGEPIDDKDVTVVTNYDVPPDDPREFYPEDDDWS